MRNIAQECFLGGQIPQGVCTLGSRISGLAAAWLELRGDAREAAGSPSSAQNQDDSASNDGLLASVSRPEAGPDVGPRRAPQPPPHNAVALGGRARAPPSAWEMCTQLPRFMGTKRETDVWFVLPYFISALLPNGSDFSRFVLPCPNL